jgi:N-glycosylase/DNA lyase
MSKQVYEETQEFLEDKWGPLGGWAQAVMFAADLKPVTPKKKGSISSLLPNTPGTPSSVKIESTFKPEWDASSPSNRTHEDSPLKRKAETREFKRTRSATRLSIKRTESDLVTEDLAKKLSVDPERESRELK